MAFFSSVAAIVLTQNKQAIGQAFVLDKKTVATVSHFIRVNTKECVKPALAVAALAGVGYAGYKIRTEILKYRAQQRVAPTPREVRNLLHTAQLVGGNCGPDPSASGSSFGEDVIEEFLLRTDTNEDMIVGEFLSALQQNEFAIEQEILDFDEYLEVDPTVAPHRVWVDRTATLRVLELEDDLEEMSKEDNDVIDAFLEGSESFSTDEPEMPTEIMFGTIPTPLPKAGRRKAVQSDSSDQDEGAKQKSVGLMSKVLAVEKHVLKYDETKKQHKRVRSGQVSNATKALAAKIRYSFPIPDGSILQQKAMCLYAAKECRKLHLRESQAATIIPQSVAIASVPSDQQVNMRMLTSLEPVKLKYNKMAWSGYDDKAAWINKLLPIFA